MRARVAALFVVAALGCDDGPLPPPTTGALQVQVVTTGGDVDLDGYLLFLDGAEMQSLGVNGSATLEELEAGEHTVELKGLATNCVVAGANPQAVTIVAEATVSMSFTITCVATAIEVMTSTTGLDFPANYEVSVDGGSTVAVPVNGSAILGRLTPGAHMVALSSSSGNCTVVEPNPKSVAIGSGETVALSFAIECVSTTGNIAVSTATTGFDRPRKGYEVAVDDGPGSGLPPNGSAVFVAVSGGAHEVKITDVPANCTVDGGSTRSVTVSTGGVTRDTAKVAFGVACAKVWSVAFSRIISDGYGDVSAVYFARADGADTLFVTLGEDADWAPDGRRIVFTACEEWSEYYYGTPCYPMGLSVADTEDEDLVSLTSHGSDADPAWRPDGEEIAFVRAGRLHLIDVGGSAARLVPVPTEVLESSNPSWSPDGTTLAFTCEVAVANVDICVVKPDGSGFARLTADPARDARPAWSPDGSVLAFATTRFGGTIEIALVAPDGSGLSRVAPGTGATHPAWLDASTLVFGGVECDIYRGCRARGLFRVSVDGADLTQLTEGRDHAPAWRP